MKKALRVGQRSPIEVASAVFVNGIIVIPAGKPAVGEITELRNKGMWSKSGDIEARAVVLRIGDRSFDRPVSSTTRVRLEPVA